MRRLLTILSLMLLLPLHALAQWSFDVPSIEAYIADHKDQRSLLLARATGPGDARTGEHPAARLQP